MNIRFHVSGIKRKALVVAVSEITGEHAAYQGAPSFAYTVGEYHIDKEGTLMGPDNQALREGLVGKGYTDPETKGPAHDLTIEVPRAGFDEAAFDNLEKLIASKAGLLRKALGTEELDFQLTEETIQFPWFTTAGIPEESDAYSRLVFALCKAAKEQKRVTAKEKPVDNEKFAFRVFLVRLGFVGPESKTARKVLLRNLEGNSAFKSGRPPKAKETQADE